jgi:hypothetical protein
MPSRIVVGALIAALSIVPFIIGDLQAGTCGPGFSYIYFSVGVLLIGSGLAVMGRVLLAVGAFVVFVILLVVGWTILGGAGCAI